MKLLPFKAGLKKKFNTFYFTDEDNQSVDYSDGIGYDNTINMYEPEEETIDKHREIDEGANESKANFKPIPGASVSFNDESVNPEHEIYKLIDPCKEEQMDGRSTIKPEPLSKICKSKDNNSGRSCPPFKPVSYPGTCGFEARIYSPGTWVATESKGSSAAFQRLFKYIQGNNEKKEKIEMTSPVCNYILMKDSQTVKSQHMAFYMENSKVPQPSDESVKIMNIPTKKLFIRAFGGRFPSQDTYEREFRILATALVNANITNIDWKNPIILEYNAPWALFKRHEVALPSL